MNKETKETAPKKTAALAKTEKKPVRENMFPMFVEAEKMLERLADLTTETAHKAFEFFVKRGGELGREIDDWFRAEAELLRAVTVEIRETDKLVSVTAAVPGFKPEEIEISLDGRELIMSGETVTEEKKEDEDTIYSEWRSNRFFRRLTLPADVDADKVKASLDHGVLMLKLPKAAPKEVKTIAVSAGKN
ncbi:MAG: Hsp20 family protein [Acidobacteria bacterium]|nr:Hsp20 family protein [Acidobacteriota bacterium]